ncbi:MAG TPA: hypothetical protein VGJ22_05960 [Anaerolineales bacterium]|jgi:hypothetical protein
MKIIDKTPFQKETGEIDLLGRLRGTLKYGFSWYSEQQAQVAVVAQLQRPIEKGFVLIRNLTLPGSEIVVPLILVGPQGVNVIYATQARGFFEAKGDEWNTVARGRSQPAAVNLLSRARLMARAVQLYIQRQNIQLSGPIEPVLIGTDPGFHVETTRPAVRVIMSDAIRQFGASLVQARPAMRAQDVFDLADRIVTPRSPDDPEQMPLTAEGPARAKAIFEAAEGAQPFNPADLSFAFDEGEDGAPMQAGAGGGNLAIAQGGPAKKARILGMTTSQLVFLMAIGLIEFCVLAVGAYIIYTQ